MSAASIPKATDNSIANIADPRARREAVQAALKETRQRKNQVTLDNLPATYSTLRIVNGLRVSETVTWPVECPIPGYEHLTVYFRTNNPSERFHARPGPVESVEWHSMGARMRNLIAEAVRTETELPPEYFEMQEERRALAARDYAAWEEAMCRWTALFVKAIPDWDFGRTVGYDEAGEPVVEAIPAPDPRDPLTYLTLYREHEALGKWLMEDGYNLALEAASRPFSRD